MKKCTSKEDIEKISKKEKYDEWKIYDDNLAAMPRRKNHVTLNKPRYVGTAVLGLSKEIMYDVHYNYMMKHYPNEKLLFTYTDLFCYQNEADGDIYKDINRKINEMISVLTS